MNNQVRLFTPFAKVDDEQRMVYGYCTTESIDSQDEVVSKDAIRKAWNDYMKFGNVREMHQASAVGVTKEFTHDDAGTWIGVRVVDDRAWKFVKEGVYKGFSIGGRVVKKMKNVISELVLAEISLVDRPANPDAVFTAIKVDDGLVNTQVEEKISNNNAIAAMKKYIEIDGVKYVEDPENVGSPLKDDEGNPVQVTEEVAETPVETPVEAPAEVPVEVPAETPAEVPVETPTETPVEGGEKADGASTVSKDTAGVITMAAVLDHLSYVKGMFEEHGKDTAGVTSVMESCKTLIAREAVETDKAYEVENLTKMASELSKALLPEIEKAFGGRLEAIAENAKAALSKAEEAAAGVEAIKATKASPRPKTAVAVEKGFEGADKNGATLQREIADITEEINKFSHEMKMEVERNPGRAAEYTEKAIQLQGRLSAKKREFTEYQAGY